MKDYQQKKMKTYLMPEPVYRQAYWALRDLKRMKEELAHLLEERDLISASVAEASNFASGTGKISDVTGNRAIKITQLSARVLAMETAFDTIPEKYRGGLWQKNVENLTFGDGAHLNTWKKWQQVLMFNVAKNLQLF